MLVIAISKERGHELEESGEGHTRSLGGRKGKREML